MSGCIKSRSVYFMTTRYEHDVCVCRWRSDEHMRYVKWMCFQGRAYGQSCSYAQGAKIKGRP